LRMGQQFCSLSHNPKLDVVKHPDADGAGQFDYMPTYSKAEQADELEVFEAAQMIASDRNNCSCERSSLVPALFDLRESPLQDPPGTFVAVHRATGVARRLVVVRKPRSPEMQDQLRATARQLQSLRCEGVVRVLEIFEDSRALSLVVEECSGGTVFDRILARQYFAEQESAVIIRHMLQSLSFMHHCGLAHGHPAPDSSDSRVVRLMQH